MVELDNSIQYQPGETSRGAYVTCLLVNTLGIFLSATKSQWKPSTRVQFLGFIVDSLDCTVEIMPEKYQRTKQQIFDLIKRSVDEGDWDIKELERIRGKLVSWMLVFPDMRLYIRELNVAIERAYRRNEFRMSNSELEDLEIASELLAWTRLENQQLKRNWYNDKHLVTYLRSETISTDASGYAGGLAFGPNRHLTYRTFQWDISEYHFAIHYKELLIIEKGIISLGRRLLNTRLKVLCDNKIVCAAFANDGVRDHKFTRILRRIKRYCRKLNLLLIVEWVPTNVQAADMPSRSTHTHDARLRTHIRTCVTTTFGPTIDLCASYENRVCARYISQYPDHRAVTVDCLSKFEKFYVAHFIPIDLGSNNRIAVAIFSQPNIVLRQDLASKFD